MVFWCISNKDYDKARRTYLGHKDRSLSNSVSSQLCLKINKLRIHHTDQFNTSPKIYFKKEKIHVCKIASWLADWRQLHRPVWKCTSQKETCHLWVFVFICSSLKDNGRVSAYSLASETCSIPTNDILFVHRRGRILNEGWEWKRKNKISNRNTIRIKRGTQKRETMDSTPTPSQ